MKPVALEMFGGKYDLEALGFPIKMFAGDEPASDIRDWTAIRAWASDLAAQFEHPRVERTRAYLAGEF